jgi:hypothetical protein
MPTRVQVRAGDVELTIESDSPLAVTDIKELLGQVQEVAESMRAPLQASLAHVPQTMSQVPPAPAPASPLLIEDNVPQLHINSVAERLGIKSGSDLAVAAAAYLQIVKGQQKFTRGELLSTMKAATSYYTRNHRSNLSAMLKNLTGSKFNQIDNDTYAIKNHELIELRGKLAE